MTLRQFFTGAFVLVGLVGMVGYLGTGSQMFGLLFLAGFLFCFVHYFVRWMISGQSDPYPQADDLRRSDDDLGAKEPRILPTNWPGPS